MTRAADLPPVRSLRRSLWAAVFAGWSALLLWLILSGGIARYLAARNRIFVVFAAITLAGMAVLQWRRSLVPHGSDEDDELHDLNCRCRMREVPRAADLASIVLFVLPVLVWSTVPAGTLGASAARSRGVKAAVQARIPEEVVRNNASPRSARPEAALSPDSARELTVLDVTYAMLSETYSAKIGLERGDRVRLVGLVVRGKPAPPDGFLLARFLVVCCVADAAPVGVIVRGAGAETIPDNTWIAAEGIVGWDPLPANKAVLLRGDGPFGNLTLERFDNVAAPADPYVH